MTPSNIKVNSRSVRWGRLTAGLTQSYQRKLATSILGMESAIKISECLENIVGELLGWHRPECFLFELSVGAVFGLSMGEEKCILKAYSSDTELESLKAQSRFQRYLSEQGFPCPPVISEPAVRDGLIFTIEGYLGKGRRADGHLKEDRKLMAKSLAELIAIGEQYQYQDELPRYLLQAVEGSPWPKPHNVLFDFPATSRGAEWIDDVGWRFKTSSEASDQTLKIGHLDWGAKHIRMASRQVSAIYDWDSVARFPEAHIIGSAAINLATSWYVSGSNRPTLVELLDFLDQYQLARGRFFSKGQRDTLVSSMLYGAGYSARCEYSIKAEAGRTENCEFLRMLLDSDLETFVERLRTA